MSLASRRYLDQQHLSVLVTQSQRLQADEVRVLLGQFP
jgi:hypothetical protein